MKLKKIKESIINSFNSNKNIRWWILSCIVIIYALTLYIDFMPINKTYNLGDIADSDIKAQEDFLVVDKDATEKNRKKVASNVPVVYDFDSTLSTKLTQRVQTAFEDIRNDLISGKFNPSKLDTNTGQASMSDRSLRIKKEFERKIGFSVPDSFFVILEKHNFSEDIPNAINRIISKILNNGIVADKDYLLKGIDKGIILRNIETKNEIITYELNSLYSIKDAKSKVKVVEQTLLKDMLSVKRDLVTYFVMQLIQPNITLNRNETEERIKSAAAEMGAVLYKVKAGEMLLREGEKVSEVQLIKLKALIDQVRYKRISAAIIGSTMIMLCLLVTTYIISINNHRDMIGDHNKKLVFLASVVVMAFLLAEVSSFLSRSLTMNELFSIRASSVQLSIPVTSGVMLICLFMGLNTAVAFAVIIAVCTAMVFQNRFEILVYFLLSGIMAAYWMQNCRERKVFIKSGLKLGLFNIVLTTIITIYSTELSWVTLLWNWFFAFFGGMITGVVTAGLTPLIEVTFNFSTDIKLLELASLDQPVLRRLMIEAPGTYHHSVIVGSMVEAAASEIGANPLLAKVCGYYHDIGKLNKPQYFIENQSDGVNKHDKLSPSMSSLILVAHVKDGVEMAKKYNLGKEIADTISQHHGKSLIRFFYDKAKQLKGDSTVKISDFRYPGPKPQTKEAGLVMLADVTESASRTLENPTPARIQGLVQNLMNNVFSDGQLDNCELTLKDLHNIAKSFNTILNGIHHHRIEYSETTVSGNGKGKNGSTDKQQPKQAQNQEDKSSESGSGHLKRLGLS
ncbi:MAG: HDIG domain-containing protein [Proteobacteria bacterium]|nr:HDIG domain-containing protein [Pseudomonadota bacterium]MBU4009469.1 HDIG domain-containing protein [Pseudomonadota bacterium]